MSDNATLSPLGIGTHTDDMTQVRSDKMTTRQQAIYDAIAGQDVAVFKDSMSQLYGVTIRTIERDFAAIAHLIIINGTIVRRDAIAV